MIQHGRTAYISSANVGSATSATKQNHYLLKEVHLTIFLKRNRISIKQVIISKVQMRDIT